MDTSFISDREIDKILGRLSEYKTDPELSTPIDRFTVSAEEKARLRSEYAMKKAQQFTMNIDATKNNRPVNNMQVLTDAFSSAGIVRRTYAFCTDLCLIGVTLAGFIFTAAYFVGVNFVNTGTTWIAILYGALFVLYMGYFESLMGQTPGKMLLNIKVVDRKNERPSFLRTIIRMLLFFVPPIGLFGLHNYLTRTRLINLG